MNSFFARQNLSRNIQRTTAVVAHGFTHLQTVAPIGLKMVGVSRVKKGFIGYFSQKNRSVTE